MNRNPRAVLLILGLWLALTAVACEPAAAKVIELVIDQKIEVPAQHGLQVLEDVLTKKGFTIDQKESLSNQQQQAFIIGQAGVSAAVDRLLAANEWTVAEKPESLLIKRLPGRPGPALG